MNGLFMAERLCDVEPGELFVQLTDCRHVFEVEGLDRWLEQQVRSRFPSVG